MGPVALRGSWVRWAHRAGSAPLLSRRRRPAASPSLLGPRSWAKASLRASLHLSSTLRLSGPAAAEMLARQLLTSPYCIKISPYLERNSFDVLQSVAGPTFHAEP